MCGERWSLATKYEIKLKKKKVYELYFTSIQNFVIMTRKIKEKPKRGVKEIKLGKCRY